MQNKHFENNQIYITEMKCTYEMPGNYLMQGKHYFKTYLNTTSARYKYLFHQW